MANAYPATYQPNEYEEMLIAAGWITIESCDDQYLGYLKRIGHDHEWRMSYAAWKSMREDWNRLDAEFDTIPDEPSGAIPMRKIKILDEMSYIEQRFGL